MSSLFTLRYLFLSTILLLCLSLSGQEHKAYFHTDKAVYAAGENLYAAIYLVDARTHRADTSDRLVNFELHDPAGAVVAARKVYSDIGHAATDLTLPDDLPPGVYQLTAYTPRELERSGAEGLYRRPIQILPGLNPDGGARASSAKPARDKNEGGSTRAEDVRLRFFPEGGDCVTGLPCRVAVVAESTSDGPVAVTGFATDRAQEEVVFFRTAETGVGSFRYVPQPGKELVATLDENGGSGTPLPTVLDEGTALEVEFPRDTIQINVRTNRPGGLRRMRLEVSVRGVPLDIAPFPNSDQTTFLLPRTILVPGVYTVTVYDDQGAPDAERLFFISPDSNQINLALERSSLGTRDSAQLAMGGSGEASLAGARYSYCILPVGATGGPQGDDIRSWLLLNSELDRSIPAAPELLFASDERVRELRIDDYLLTREWRRFGRNPTAAARPADGLYLRGRMTRLQNRDAARLGKVWLSRFVNAYEEATLTDEEGYFEFGPYVLFDTIGVQIQGRYRTAKKNFNNDISLEDNSRVNLEVIEPEPPLLPPYLGSPPAPREDYAELSRKSLTIARNYDSLIVDLDVIDVITTKVDPIEESRRERTYMYSEPDNRVVIDDILGAASFTSIFDLLFGIPGVRVVGSGLDASVQIRGVGSINSGTQPLFVFDGMIVDIQAFRNIPPNQVEFIDVLKGATAAVYGSRGSNGVILAYSRTGLTAGGSGLPGILDAELKGYHRPRQFAIFNDQLPENDGRTDLRTTLHWQPLLFAGTDGLATDKFLTSDQRGKFIIIAQGLSLGGRPLYGTSEFEVR